MNTVQTAAHSAVLDPMTGAGLLLRPSPSGDLCLLGTQSLHAADWDAMLRTLYALGFEPLADDDDMPLVDDTLPDGSEVVGLSCIAEPIISQPSLAQLAEATTELRSALLGE